MTSVSVFLTGLSWLLLWLVAAHLIDRWQYSHGIPGPRATMRMLIAKWNRRK